MFTSICVLKTIQGRVMTQGQGEGHSARPTTAASLKWHRATIFTSQFRGLFVQEFHIFSSAWVEHSKLIKGFCCVTVCSQRGRWKADLNMTFFTADIFFYLSLREQLVEASQKLVQLNVIQPSFFFLFIPVIFPLENILVLYNWLPALMK